MADVAGFVIHGAPRTKKNHSRVISIPIKGKHRCHVCGHMPGFPKLLPSEQYEEWEKLALREMMAIKPKLGIELPITGPVGVEALIYRERNVGDLSNYLEAIADMLQAAGVLKDDRLIEDWDGSRRLLDRVNPRVEVYITMLDQPQGELCLSE